MKRTAALILLSIAIMQIACFRADSTENTLDEAQSLMESRPDSALSILKCLDRSRLRSRARQARFALLYSQALDKNFIDLESDSVIAPAVRYYSKHGRKRDKAYTAYYLGCIRYNAGDLDRAVRKMVEARSAAADLNDSYLLARTCSCLGRMYQDQHSFEQAEAMFANAEQLFRGQGDTINWGYIVMNRAGLYSLTGDSDKSISAYKQAKRLFRHSDDADLLSSIDRCLIDELKEDPSIPADSLKRLLAGAYSVSQTTDIPSSDYSLWAAIYHRDNQVDSARYFGKRALERNPAPDHRRCGMILRMSRIEESEGNYRTANEYLHEYIALNDSINRLEKEQCIKELEEKYRNEELLMKNELSRTKRRYSNIAWSIATAASLFLMAGVLIGRIRRYRRFIGALHANYDAFKKRYLQLAQEIDGKTAEEAHLLKALENKLKGFQVLLDKAYNPHKQQHFIEEFKRYVTSISRHESAFDDLQFVVNKKYNGLADRLRTLYPTLTRSELDILCMLRFGFSYDCIRLLYRHNNIYSIYSRRTRIHRKMGLPHRKQIEEYLTELSDETLSQPEETENTRKLTR